MDINIEKTCFNTKLDIEKEGRRLQVLPCVINDFLKEVEAIFKKAGSLTDDSLLALHSLFGSPLERALELVETNCVVYLRAPSGRYVVQVTGSSGMPYTLFPGVNYCPCPAYRYQVIGTQSFLTCKHVLTAYLSELMGQGRDLQVSGEVLTRLLCSAINLERDELT